MKWRVTCRVQTSAILLRLLSAIICRICSFTTGIKILFFDKNRHILILTKKEVFFSKDANFFYTANEF